MRREINTEITINANSKLVWDILTDLETYFEWNPFIVNAQGVIALGECLICEPAMPGGWRYSFAPKVTRCISGKEFAWTGTVIHPRIASGEHIFILEEMEQEKVKLKHDEVFSGVFAPLVMRASGKATERGFVLMNEALKAHAESLRTGHGSANTAR